MLNVNVGLTLIEQFNKDLSDIELALGNPGGISGALQIAKDHLTEFKKVLTSSMSDESRPSSPSDSGNTENDTATATSENIDQDKTPEAQAQDDSDLVAVNINDEAKSKSEEVPTNDSEQLPDAGAINEDVSKEDNEKPEADNKDQSEEVPANDSEQLPDAGTAEEDNNEESSDEPEIILNDNYQPDDKTDEEMKFEPEVEMPAAENVEVKEAETQSAGSQTQDNVTNVTEEVAKTEPEQVVAEKTEPKSETALGSIENSSPPQTEVLGDDAIVPDPA